MVGSILLIYNSFAISISERSRQFGILSSVGATKKQIRGSVLFEGMYIGAIGIPLGVLVGLGGIGLTLELIGDITRSMSATDTPLRLHPSLPSIVIAAAVGVATILISAYIPAARAVRKSAIDIIRQADDINIKPKEVRTSNAVRRLFGLEGALALKSFKRNRKRYRSTVISLFVSVVLFISASAFGLYITQATVMTTEDVNYDLLFSPPSSWRSDDAKLLGLYEKMKDVDGVYRSAYQKDIDFSALIKKDSLNDRFLEYIAPGSDPGDTVEEFVNVRFIDDEAYDRYLKSLGLNKDDYGLARGRLPSVAKIMGYDESEQRTVSMDIFNKSDVTLNLTEAPGADSAIPGEDEQAAPPRELALTVVDAMPGEFSEAQTYGIDVYAPYSDMAVLDAPAAVYNNFSIAFLSNDPMKSADGIKAVMKDEGITSGYNFFNAAEELEQNRNNILIINIFIYGFIILISLITIANVFNTISTSINLRRREIAMLRSVGMGERSFGRMMNFECLFYGLKSLTYGLPVAVAVTWFIYRAVLNGVDVAFTLPWGSVAIGVFSVFFVVFVTMIYATAKMRRTNVIDALRDDMI
jgi:putative ABC transport system permease protein